MQELCSPPLFLGLQCCDELLQLVVGHLYSHGGVNVAVGHLLVVSDVFSTFLSSRTHVHFI